MKEQKKERSSLLRQQIKLECSFYGDEVYWNNKTGYSKYSKTYNYSKKYYSFNSKLIPEKRVQ